MDADRDTDQAVWYLAATPAAVSKWLVRLWRTSAVIEVLVVATAFLLPAETFPLRRLAPVLAAAALISLERASGRARTPQVSRLITAAHAMLQVLLLTGLLELSGGPSNALSVIYAVLIALTAVTLGAWWASLVAGWSAVCYGLLISWHLEELVPAHHRLIDFPTHLFTMALAIATMAELAAHFVGAASRAVARREAELDLMRRQAARTERLVSLTTLAAGAAHELSTPLATIAIASKELERALARAAVPGGYADARLIREEVDRCQLILDQMSGRAGGSAAELPEAVGIETVKGPGMSQDALHRAGEPFYTTKVAGQGMGLGLFLARAFAERCGGSLSLRSDRGTTAILELPSARPRIEAAS